MPAPSKNFTVVADSDIDPDSPITTGLVTAHRDNDIHLEEWLGLDYTAAQNHNHDGINSAPVALNGLSIFAFHGHEIYDHFMYDTTWLQDPDNPFWTVVGAPTVVNSAAAAHYAVLGTNTDRLVSKTIWRIEYAKIVLEVRAKLAPTVTDWVDVAIGIGTVAGRRAMFVDAAGADGVRCQTNGSGGTQNTDITIGSGGIDAWHVYKIDQTSASTTIFSVDGTVVATHSTAVPDANDLSVFIQGTATDLWIDWVKFYATQEASDSTA